MSIKSKGFIFVIFFIFILSGFSSFSQDGGVVAETSSESDSGSDTEIQENQESGSAQVVKELVVTEDELPIESVVPITDNKSTVLNKKIKFTKRFQFDLNTGMILDEPFVNTNYFLLRGSYYINEEYSFGLGTKSRSGGKTSYADQLYQNSAQLDFDRAPSPTQSHFVSFGYNFYYGKISLGKNIVIPASTRLETDFGMQSFGSATKPFIQSAVTESFYMTNRLSLGLSIGLSIAQILDATSANIRSSQPVPSASNFDDKIHFNQYLSINLNALL